MMTPASEIRNRVARVQARMAGAGIDAMLVLQTSDLFWLAGSIQQGALWVPASGEPLYMVRKDLGRAREESGLARIVPLRSPKDLAGCLAEAGLAQASRVGMELDVVPVSVFRRWEAVLGGATITDASPLLRAVRSVKSAWEVERMRASAVVSAGVFAHAAEVLRPGISEIEFAAALEHEARRLGHQGFVRMRAFNAELFYGHIFAGPDSAMPGPYDTPLGGRGPGPAVGQGAGPRRIGEREPVVVDLATAVDGYLADQTRTLCIGGLPDELVAAYADMVRIQDRMVEVARPGLAWGRVYDECLALARSLGHADRFMGPAGSQVSFIGHGVGVELDEPPFIARGFADSILEPGMTFAFEPKVVFPGVGAVGVEDTFLVTGDGVERLTLGPRDLVVVRS